MQDGCSEFYQPCASKQGGSTPRLETIGTRAIQREEKARYDEWATKTLHLSQSLTEMIPSQSDGERFYVAEGKWDITVLNESGPQLQYGKEGQHFPMVAGVGFEPTTFGL